jgi:ABC-type multidrug transport system ATPase subunit
MSLIARPSVLFLDEPTTGLDPRSRIDVWELIGELVAAGTTTLLTTQYLDEADALADEIAVIDRGVVIARGTSRELKTRIGGDLIEVTLSDPADASGVVELLGDRACGEVKVERTSVIVPVTDVTGVLPDVVRRLDAAGIGVADVAARASTLDDVFFALTGRPAEDGEPAGDAPAASSPNGANGADGASPSAPADGTRVDGTDREASVR